MVRRALLTFATGDFDELLDISWPGLRAYADRHDYELHDWPPRLLLRPHSWGKVPLLLEALESYDEVVWVDADVVVLDDSRDLAAEVPADAWQALTRHRTWQGEIPSCGLWLVREPMRPWLERIWSLERYTHHPWWEQAALHELLGYGGMPVAHLTDSELYDRTCWLAPEWHHVRLVSGEVEYPDGDPPAAPRFVHAGPGASVRNRAALMHELLEGSVTHA